MSSVLRSDLAPIPVTLEADIRAGDDQFDKLLSEGRLISTASGDEFYIVKSVRIDGSTVQDDRRLSGYRITAIINACLPVAFVRSRAIIKENASLAAIYRAAGATIRGIDGDFPVPRFYCPVGETPTFHIAKILQEQGGVVRWKNHRLQFFTLSDLMRQKVSRTISGNATDTVQTGFLERHSVPFFFSLNEAGAFVFGNRSKPRKALYSRFKNVQRLRNLTRCLIHRKTAKMPYDIRICAGDVIQDLDGTKYAVQTAAHVYESGTDSGDMQNAYTRVWLATVEE